MVCRLAVEILTIRLAELLGPEEQVAFVAVEVSPVSAEAAVSAVPEDWPELPAHSTV